MAGTALLFSRRFKQLLYPSLSEIPLGLNLPQARGVNFGSVETRLRNRTQARLSYWPCGLKISPSGRRRSYVIYKSSICKSLISSGKELLVGKASLSGMNGGNRAREVKAPKNKKMRPPESQ